MKKISLALAFVLVWCFEVSAQAPYYQGKQVRIVVGNTAGGFFDRWARLLARYLPKYIPGNPDIIVQNMPGAGSMVASNYVYGVAKPDGLTLGMPNPGIYLDQLVGRAEVTFDVRKFFWIGSPVREPILLYMRSDAPYKSIADMRAAKQPARCGSTGTSSSDYILARLLEEALPPLKIQTVLGYQGGSEIDVGVERGEVQCRGMTASPFFGREPFLSWEKKNFVRVLLYTGKQRHSKAPESPTIYEIFEKEKVPESSRRVAEVILAAEDFGRPIMAAPGTAAEQVKILRAGFNGAIKDPELLAEAEKGRMEVDPVSGEELQRLAQRVMDQPPEVLARVKKLMGN
ncbi:MAG TPA: tripartite tricarboxylate transporter substrate-binding protein [Candidatus Binatia bacterium]|jgi:tripartite-type tricarboxylate transporter receptor subunit TctC|nr:tripartite tricarboxylate transporter substrate-binding protein [Candidatus Binatia bacterium]